MKVLNITFSIKDIKGSIPSKNKPEINFEDLQNEVYGDLGFYQKFHNIEDIIEDEENGTITLIALYNKKIVKKSEKLILTEV